jgi:hypothetical protein
MQVRDIANQSTTPRAQPGQQVQNQLRSLLRNRLILAGTGIAIAVAGTALGWGWLTAIGAAPIILSVAPCLVMCALGMCMMGMGNRSRSMPLSATQSPEPPVLAPGPEGSAE